MAVFGYLKKEGRFEINKNKINSDSMVKYMKTNLWIKLSTNESLTQRISDIRSNCIVLGESIKSLIPGFTDHSINHMDALWSVADSVFTKDEIERFTVAEAFVLGASFYFHDLGMSIAATKEGVQKLKENEKYMSYYTRCVDYYKEKSERANIIALQLTARAVHAETAMTICAQVIPGLDKYIIENQDVRIKWANFIGEVSASHHWSINLVDQNLGSRGIIPSPEGGNMDIAFVACALRIIDYAHINSERASYVERLLRLNVDDDSLLHWKAQESINGPTRHENKLKFASNKPIEDVEAWWLFYDMALGLDREITSVSEYLDSRTCSQGRFSLEGVQSVRNPKSFSSIVRTLNFEPIDIRFKPDSIERLVEILGGKTLYGNDRFAPIRELLQNSRDAILLRQEDESKINDSDFKGKITVSIDNSSSVPRLIIKDNGIGMSSNVIEDYLLGIASDYWNSQDFYNDFPDAKKKGFSPTGKFGIGFLSVFMIGDFIEVETERKGKSNLKLLLKGLGKHGSLVSSSSKGAFGTTIGITISKQDASIYNNLELIVKARAPMLTFPLHIRATNQTSIIEPDWWKSISQRDLFDFITKWESYTSNGDLRLNDDYEFSIYSRHYGRGAAEYSMVNRFEKWPDKQPEIIGSNYRLLAIPNFGEVILCSKGIAIKTISLQGLTGIAEIDDITLTASRNQTIKWNREIFVKKVISEIKPKVLDSLNKLIDEGMIPTRFAFIKNVAETYGVEILQQTTLPWISILMPPGETRLFNVLDAGLMFSKTEEILISYGTGPWSTEKMCRDYYPSASNDALVIPVNNDGQPTFGSYTDPDEITTTTLPNHFDSKQSTAYERAIFLVAILEVIAKAWNVDSKQLINSEWLRKKSSYLCVHFKRSDFR